MQPARPILLGLVIAASASSFARAEPRMPVDLGEGFALVSEPAIGGPQIYVTKGKLRTRLGSASYVDGAHIDPSARSVTLDLENACNISYKETWTYGALEARLENTTAYQLHQKKSFQEAALGFARAAAADPTWNIPAYNLASAHTLLGDQDAAIKALAPWLASAPIATYVQVTSDPELAPLLARPELAVMRAKRPGTVTVTAEGITGRVAITADRTLLAVVREEHDSGSMAFERQLDIYNAATRTFVATTPLVNATETDPLCDPTSEKAKSCALTPAGRTAVARRAPRLQKMLRELGFSPAVLEPATVLEHNGRWGKKRLAFPRQKLGLVEEEGVVRVLQRNTELGTGRVAAGLDTAVFVEQPRLVLLWSSNPGSENGCQSGKGSYVDLIPVSR